MSASVSGKFQDHYVILGVEPSADLETIRAAYATIAEKYEGDEIKIEAFNQALEVLSDPELRASFDKVKGVDPHEHESPKFTGAEFFEALEQSAGLRSAVLSILYDRRRIKSFKPSLSMRHLEGMLHVTPEELNFSLWYLKKRKYVVNDDKSSMEITVEGMDFLEQNRPSEKVVMRFLREDALTAPAPASAPPAPVVLAKMTEPVGEVLGRAIQRKKRAEEAQTPVTLRF